MQPLLFAACWLLWCLLHSLLISGPLARAHERLFGRAARLAYNLIALLTLLPLLYWEHAQASPPLLAWPPLLWPLRLALLLLAMWLAWAGAKAFDLGEFSGLAPLRRAPQAAARPAQLLTGGILARVRHPWYAAGLLLLWLRDQQLYSLIGSVLLSLYLLLGALLEERRLLRRYGDAYSDYRRRVPMFFPRWPRGRS